ncbi:hypothetical protein GCM10007301_39180 [Azorhizobium oxalatiphilum]|uniref:DUF2628 domain-containing protein n=1 Tax=Azorhizobium oxalatiphilum TaxID=980631 RepID=A0A917FGI6_9HYPH|nr:DUF2628 domain-containing protein [Azorhizobium oxalatiphilum]GGF75440.1 hypothetical protein GCM10007301_39180 [Azorhizobium oxalatiphilum]
MASWTVLEKQAWGDTPLRAAERVVFVRERFSWLALLFAPLVLLRYGLWLVFAAYVVVAIILGVAEQRFGLDDTVTGAVTLGFHVLIALELSALRIRKLLWQGYAEAGTVVARDILEAEHRFFAQWTPTVVSAVPPPLPPPLPPQASAVSGGRPSKQPGPVIGGLAEPYPS